ncbi:MAG: methionyl-tRNA formyltransferase [Pseudobdellovibrionaceae bacterium]
MTALRIIFMGTPDFAVPALQALIDSPHQVIAVYSQPPRPKGRGHEVQRSPVHTLADTHHIPVFTPLSFKKDADAIKVFENFKADIAVVAAYGLILPETVLNAPRYGCLNIHASLLPRWRGASPIQHAIWKGDTETGVTIMQMDKGLDTGAMIAKASCPITSTTTTALLHDQLSIIGAPLLMDVLSQIQNGHTLKKEDQDDAHSIYAPLLRKEDGQIIWSDEAILIDRQIRALNPWPGTYAELQGQNFKIRGSQISAITHNAPSGTLLDKQGHIACGNGTVLQLTSLQPDNKKAMSFADILNGYYLKVGS